LSSLVLTVTSNKASAQPSSAGAIGLVARAVAHVYELWGRLWFIPLLPAAYAIVLFAIGDLRWEHVVISVAVAAIAFGNRTSRSFFILTSPFLLTAWGDDAIRYLIPLFVTPRRILGCAMRNAELALFRVAPNETLSDYFAIHHAPVFDVLAAIPYAIFWMFPLFYAAYLFYVDRPRLSFYLWSLLVAQAVVWFMWLAFPAAPPWYIMAHGCAIDPAAAPNAAALLRVDQLFGFHYFQDFYNRGMTTFGALPSGHCVFPMIGLITAWQWVTWRTRPLHLLYVTSMVVASVYLGHHWLIDGLAALVVSTMAAILVSAAFRWWGRPRSILEPCLGESASGKLALTVSVENT
jgi:inositol phosphorylceramide synthase catalytic subunit